MPVENNIVHCIHDQGILPLFYHDDFEISLKTITAMYAAGIRVVEYTNRGNRALKNFTRLRRMLQTDCPGILLGAGTVKNITEAGQFINAGADFIVSPLVDVHLGDYIFENEVLWIPGAMTPSEISYAQTCGASLIKIFPAGTLGIDFLAAVRDIFPGQHFMPTGGIGITEQSLHGWFTTGAYAIGMGSGLVTAEILRNTRYDELFEKTSSALALIKQVRL